MVELRTDEAENVETLFELRLANEIEGDVFAVLYDTFGTLDNKVWIEARLGYLLLLG